MLLKQVSVFVENKSGKLFEILKLLGDNNIDISALSIADTTDYGILRLVLNKPKKAVEILKENNFIVKIHDVIAIRIDNKPGGLVSALDLLRSNNIEISYLYAFVASLGNSASVMLKVDDLEKARKLFKDNGIEMIKAEDIQEE
ncbi:MAG: hypothetical protein IJS58_05010 [Bacilli bacterium]|nr:hypothetical protein [Bacilli bacterium]